MVTPIDAALADQRRRSLLAAAAHVPLLRRRRAPRPFVGPLPTKVVAALIVPFAFLPARPPTIPYSAQLG